VDAGDSLAQIQITSLESAGSLQLSGADVTLGQVISEAEITAGNLTFTPAPSENGIPYDSFEFRVHDGTAYSASAYTMTVDVTPTNDPPVIGNQGFSIAENRANGTVVGTVSATDPDVGDTLSYAITWGDPGGAFTIDAATGEITVADSARLNFEAAPVFNLIVTVTDAGGLTDSAAVTVTVTDVNESPTASNATFSLAEDSADGTVVGTVAASDPDTGDTLTYAITAGDPDGAFAIDAATGEITVADSSQLDFESTPVFDLTVTVTDAGGLTATASAQITLDTPPAPPSESAPDPLPDPEPEPDPLPDPDPKPEPVPEESPPPDETPEPPPVDAGLPDVSAAPPETMEVASPDPIERVAIELAHQPDVRFETRSDALSVTRSAIEVFQRVFEHEPLIVPGASLTDLIFEQNDFLEELDRLQEEIDTFVGLETTVAGSSIAVTMGLSIGYVIWLTRGGLLLASLLSSLPAWRLIDPIAVLAYIGVDEGEDPEDEESLDTLLGGSSEPEMPGSRRPDPSGEEEPQDESPASGG
jgi:VCBS repeat-containing protein